MKTLRAPLLLLLLLVSSLAVAQMQRTPAPQEASVYIISPADGETVPTTFSVIFGLRGMGVAPAGTEKESTGHHHLMVDGEMMPAMDQPLSQEIKHFGGGQTEAELTLSPGKHTLQLILGDKAHIPHEPPVVSDPITITVK
ncbi:DUF4399 domain-containing protein [Sedimenticola hydrogenitrophicus]|uniref:DUF4399 domain-containing protein n=1 Tax=Sedimenticola hydrogenitrophicus TaxID=2967975 RepID=UPI0021A5E5D9|nr:DUF4399 domain-containing protein [Sedimenticola hydrogenitrophicus]